MITFLPNEPSIAYSAASSVLHPLKLSVLGTKHSSGELKNVLRWMLAK